MWLRFQYLYLWLRSPLPKHGHLRANLFHSIHNYCLNSIDSGRCFIRWELCRHLRNRLARILSQRYPQSLQIECLARWNLQLPIVTYRNVSRVHAYPGPRPIQSKLQRSPCLEPQGPCQQCNYYLRGIITWIIFAWPNIPSLNSRLQLLKWLWSLDQFRFRNRINHSLDTIQFNNGGQ